MIDRTYLQAGYCLETENGKMIRITSPAGQGGTALTYHGEELIEGQESVRVLLKELYPECEGIIRKPDGAIVGCSPEAVAMYERLADSLGSEQELGNQIAKTGNPGVYPMTQVVRDAKTGNWYGLFYQCPPSISLGQLVEKAGARMTLCGKLRLILSLCRQVEALHKDGGYCHNDISRGNVLVMGNMLADMDDMFCDWAAMEQGLHTGLIDFACAAKFKWNKTAEFPWAGEEMCFHTDGFSAPELYNYGSREVTAAADVFSVAACLWYLLTGKCLNTSDGYPMVDEADWEFFRQRVAEHELCALSGDVRAAFGYKPNLVPVPGDVIRRLEEILERGLAEKKDRYGSMDVMTERLGEVIDLLEGFSVSEEMLAKQTRSAFEAKRKKIRSNYVIREGLLPEAEADGEKMPLAAYLRSGKSVYVIGAGGAGKTTSLFKLAEETYKWNRSVIPVYVELNKLPVWKPESGISAAEYWLGTDGRPSFLEQYLAAIRYGCPENMVAREDFTAGALRRNLERRALGEAAYLFLLDGLNEMAFSSGDEKRAFSEAINWYLTHGHNMRIVLTGRYDEAYVDSEKIMRVRVTGLTEESVLQCLEEEVNAGRMAEKEFKRLSAMDRTSNLWKCFRLPLFLMMYCEIHNKEEISGAGDILRQFFHDKKEAVDGNHGYSERVIAEEKYRGQMFAEGISMELAQRIAVDFLLPEIGFHMVGIQRFFVDKETASRIICGCLEGKWSEARVKRYGYHTDLEAAKKCLLKAGAEKILNDICVNMGILSKSGEESYFFPHQYYRDHFAAMAIIGALVLATEPEQSACMDFLRWRPWPDSVLMLCGENLGIHRTAPVYDGTKWVQPGKWDPLVDRALNLVRFDENITKDKIYQNRKTGVTDDYRAINLVNMICLSRRYGARADLSGVDLSRLDLRAMDLKNVIFSHPAGVNGLYADLHQTSLKIELMEDPYESSADYDHRDYTYLTPDGVWMLVVRRDGDRTVMEEREILGDEVRPMGYWGRYQAHAYRDDGRILCMIDQEVRAEGWREIIHFYDRWTGQTVSEKLPEGYTSTLAWCNDEIVLIRECGSTVSRVVVGVENSRLHMKEDILELKAIMRFTQYEILGKDAILAQWGDELLLLRLMEDGEKELTPIYGGSYPAIDRKRGIAYFTDGHGALYTIDESGETQVEAESENLCGVRRLQFADDKLYIRTFDGLFEWNLSEQYLRLVKRLDRETEWKQWDVTFGGLYGATENGYVFRLSDGATICSPEKRSREDILLLNWVAPSSQKNRLAIYNANENILYQYAVARDHSLYCTGHTFLESEVRFPYAICTDQEKNMLKVFGALRIEFFNLETGERLKKGIDLPDEITGRISRFYIENAAFAPGGESLELKIVYQKEDVFPYSSETVFYCWNFETGTVTEREPESKNVNRYMFDLRDIMSGHDSGLRYPVDYPKDDIAYWRRNSYQNDFEVEDFEEGDYDPEPGIMKKFKAFRGKISDKALEPRGRIACPVIFLGENYGGIGSEGDELENRRRGVDFLFWDAEKERMIGYRNALTEDDLDESEIISFDNGFLLRTEDKIVRYVMDKWKLEKCLPKDRMDYLWAGCADGAEWSRLYRWWEKRDNK